MTYRNTSPTRPRLVFAERITPCQWRLCLMQRFLGYVVITRQTGNRRFSCVTQLGTLCLNHASQTQKQLAALVNFCTEATMTETEFDNRANMLVVGPDLQHYVEYEQGQTLN